MAEPVQFVFSFRSPYAWLAARCVLPKLPAGTEVRWRPFFPLPSFANFPPLIEGKVRYLVRDVARLCRHYDVPLRFPTADDPDWAIPHAAFLAADAQGRGPQFALRLYAARWERGEDVAREDAISCAAEEASLDPAPLLAASRDAGRRDALRAEVQRAFDEEGIFGVPTLILPRGSRFWGHDRIEMAIREGWIAA